MMLPQIHSPEGLYGRVLARVARARVMAARVQFAVLSALSCALTLALVPLVRYAAQELYASGFYEYLSLAFSDSGWALGSREFALSLVESLPSLALLLVLVTGAALAVSLWRTVRAGRQALGHTHRYV